MFNHICFSLVLFFHIFLFTHQVRAESFFDFDEINAPRNKRGYPAAIDSYMEKVYGSAITVSPKTEIGNPSGNLGRGAAALTSSADSFLKNGKGKNSSIVLSFDAAPISSFSVDSQVFKRGVGIIIKADGVIIYQHLLTKAEKRSGIMDSIDPIFFDKPVHTLEFIGVNKTKIGIDDLKVNLSQASADFEDQFVGVVVGGVAGTPGAPEIVVAAVPEPSSLILLGIGFLAVSWLARRYSHS